ncbi:hypothetical protein BKA64DRAFT_8153 [Cadophora sp. MPI-SDFR-AT-0126]|nr:hypothetical protein BKA64DRAFT_8153 [Leotiomycetes sp. MPI-SDFR-AT-0126]
MIWIQELFRITAPLLSRGCPNRFAGLLPSRRVELGILPRTCVFSYYRRHAIRRLRVLPVQMALVPQRTSISLDVEADDSCGSKLSLVRRNLALIKESVQEARDFFGEEIFLSLELRNICSFVPAYEYGVLGPCMRLGHLQTAPFVARLSTEISNAISSVHTAQSKNSTSLDQSCKKYHDYSQYGFLSVRRRVPLPPFALARSQLAQNRHMRSDSNSTAPCRAAYFN